MALRHEFSFAGLQSVLNSFHILVRWSREHVRFIWIFLVFICDLKGLAEEIVIAEFHTIDGVTQLYTTLKTNREANLGDS